MPQLYNTVTKVWQMVPPSDVNNPIYSTGPVAEVVEVIEEPAPKPAAKAKKKSVNVQYVPEPLDADKDGLVQDGTIFERPVGTTLSPEELTAAKESTKAE